MLKAYSKGKRAKGGKWRKGAQYLQSEQIEIECHMEVPSLGHSLSMWACLLL
jgi:hypothetical protein